LDGAWTAQDHGRPPLPAFAGVGEHETLLGVIARSADAALRSLVFDRGGPERQTAFWELHSALERQRDVVGGQVTQPTPDTELAFLNECLEAGWYLAVCTRSLLSNAPDDLDVVADNLEDAARHAAFFALAGGLLHPRRRTLRRPVVVDRRSPASLWAAARDLVTVRQDRGRVEARLPLLAASQS
jgi:hypothetical protein